MSRSAEGTAQRRKLLGEIERLAERSLSLERSRKLTAPADERAAIVRAVDPSMVRI